MSRPASDVALATAFGSVVTALAYPLAAPVIASATTGAALDWAAYISSFDLSAIPSFWSSGQWVSHVPAIAAFLAAATLLLYAYAASTRAKGEREVDGGMR